MPELKRYYARTSDDPRFTERAVEVSQSEFHQMIGVAARLAASPHGPSHSVYEETGAAESEFAHAFGDPVDARASDSVVDRYLNHSVPVAEIDGFFDSHVFWHVVTAAA